MNKTAYIPPNLPISWVLSHYYCHTRACRKHPLTNGFICGKRYVKRRHSVRFATLYSACVHPRACACSHSAHTHNVLHALTYAHTPYSHSRQQALAQTIQPTHSHVYRSIYTCQIYIYKYACIHMYVYYTCILVYGYVYGVATISRLLKITSPFRRI